MENEDVRAFYTTGREAFQRGDYQKAIELLEKFNQSHPNFADVHNMLGQAYHSVGLFDIAIKSFEKALEINPKYTDAALSLAVILFDLGRYDQATEIQQKLQKETDSSGDRLDPFARKKLANMHAEIADIYHGLGLWEQAVDEYRRALEMAPDFPDVRTSLAETYRDQRRFAEALVELKKVKEMAPNFLPARVSLGTIYFSMNRLNEAIAEWDEVLQIDPAHPTARTFLRMLSQKKSG